MNSNVKTMFLSIALILGLLLPDNSISYFTLGLLPILLFLFHKDKTNFKVDKNLLSFFFIIILSFVINAFSDGNINEKAVLRLLSFGFLFLLFPFASNVHIPNWALYFSLLFIFTSQIAFSLGIPQVVSLIDSFYPYQGDKLGYNSEYLLGGAGDINFMVNRRYGGIYRNPNQAVRYVSLLFIAFLIENRKTSFIKKLPFILLVFSSIILSGSRTGLLLTLLVLLYSVYLYEKKSIDLKTVLFSIVLILGLGVSYVFLSDFGLRIFDISKGAEGSLNAKFTFFNQFFNQLNSSIKFLFGHFSSDNIELLYGVMLLDSEWGELFYSFGFFGCITLLFFYRKLYLLKDSNIRFFMLILFWGITSTILFSFKMSFIFMLLLSKYYSEYLQNKYGKHNY